MKLSNEFFLKKVLAADNRITTELGFQIPSLAKILGYVIRFFFIIAGLAAMLYLLLGALAWITSGGEKEAVNKAQQKIQAAVVGLIVLVLVLAVIVTIEQVIFNGKVCLGLTCDLNFGNLLQ